MSPDYKAFKNVGPRYLRGSAIAAAVRIQDDTS